MEISKKTIQDVLKMHKAWLDELPQGKPANLSEAWLTSDISLEGVNLNRAFLRGITFLYGDMRGADLSYTDLSYADLAKTDLRQADLSSANLRSIHLEGANLRGADLRGANLICADLRGADLSYANLRGACLYHTNLSGANLEGMYAINTDLYNANLNDANFPWLVKTSGVGSVHDILYMANFNAVFCRGFESCKGRSLADFQAMVEETYPINHSTGKNFIPYMYCMNAIKMFEGMREAYLEYKARWKR